MSGTERPGEVSGDPLVLSVSERPYALAGASLDGSALAVVSDSLKKSGDRKSVV